MFTEKEIAIAISAQQYGPLRQAYLDLAAFIKCEAPITFNAIRVANGFKASPDFAQLINGNSPTPPVKDDYREKRKYIRENNAGRSEAELNKMYPELGFGSLEERAEDLPQGK